MRTHLVWKVRHLAKAACGSPTMGLGKKKKEKRKNEKHEEAACGSPMMGLGNREEEKNNSL